MQLAERILEAAKQRNREALQVSAFDLGRLIETAVAQADPVAKQHGVTLVPAPPSRPVEIRGDDELLARVLDNLIANAIRFSPRGAPSSSLQTSRGRSGARQVYASNRSG